MRHALPKWCMTTHKAQVGHDDGTETHNSTARWHTIGQTAAAAAPLHTTSPSPHLLRSPSPRPFPALTAVPPLLPHSAFSRGGHSPAASRCSSVEHCRLLALPCASPWPPAAPCRVRGGCRRPAVCLRVRCAVLRPRAGLCRPPLVSPRRLRSTPAPCSFPSITPSASPVPVSPSLCCSAAVLLSVLSPSRRLLLLGLFLMLLRG